MFTFSSVVYFCTFDGVRHFSSHYDNIHGLFDREFHGKAKNFTVLNKVSENNGSAVYSNGKMTVTLTHTENDVYLKEIE